MSGALYRRQMQDLARDRHTEGLRLQETHRDQHGICTSCGRNSPCDSHLAGVELVTRYAGFLAAPEPPADTPTASIRPYAVPAPNPNAGGHW